MPDTVNGRRELLRPLFCQILACCLGRRGGFRGAHAGIHHIPELCVDVDCAIAVVGQCRFALEAGVVLLCQLDLQHALGGRGAGDCAKPLIYR